MLRQLWGEQIPSSSMLSPITQISFLEGLPDESRGPSQRRQNRSHELDLQREAVEEDHQGVHREGRQRRVQPVRGV